MVGEAGKANPSQAIYEPLREELDFAFVPLTLPCRRGFGFMRYLLLALFSVLYSLFTPPLQGQNLDSLWGVWNNETQADTARLEAMFSIAGDGYLHSKPDSAFYFAQMMYDFAKAKNLKREMANALIVQGTSFRIRNDYEQALSHALKGLKMLEKDGRKSDVAYALVDIGLIYGHKDDNSEALVYFQRGLKMMREMGDRNGIAVAVNNIGIHYKMNGDYTKALEYYEESLRLKEEEGDRLSVAICLTNIANIYSQQGNLPKALETYQRSLKISEEIGDDEGVAYCINNIGVISYHQQDYPQALKYFKKSLEHSEKRGDKNGMAQCLQNIGSIYSAQNNDTLALEYRLRSLKIYQEIGSKAGVAAALNNIGHIYSKQNEYALALEYFYKSLDIDVEAENKHEMALTLYNIGNVHQKRAEYGKAIIECEKSLKLADEIGSVEQQKGACKCLYNAYKALGKGNEALAYHERMIVYKDSIFNKENTKKLTTLELQYEFDKKEATAKLEQEKKDAIAAEELRRNKLVRNGFIGGFSVVLLFAVTFLSQRNKIKKGKKQSDELLLNILPAEVAEELKAKGETEAKHYDEATILFTDFKGFTSKSENLTPKELVDEINICFKAFDRICEKYRIEKIKTIGDAYMAASGLSVQNSQSEVSSAEFAKNMVEAALQMQQFMIDRNVEMEALNTKGFEMRAGVHTGPVVAGIVGIKKFQYDIWGDTVNTASRMESASEVGKLNISQPTYELLKNDAGFVFESRGRIEVKGKGEIEMWFVSYKMDS